MDRINLQSKDLLKENIEKIAELFPNVITEKDGDKKIDFEALKQELSDTVIEGNEKYQLTWPGKKSSILLANTPTNYSLKPIPEESVDFENTQNLYIEGDNLEVLKILQESYTGKIKCIYIDPPYNTGKNLIYKNDFSVSEHEYKKYFIDNEGVVLTTNSDTNGRFHSDWLSMMFPRIKLVRNLLREDGCAVFAMDESEIINLTKICDEIFGEENRIGIVTVVHKPEGRNQEKFFATSNEFALFYAKDISLFNFEKIIIDETLESSFEFEDEVSKYKLTSYIAKNHGRAGYDKNLRINNPNNFYPIYVSKDLSEITLSKKEGYTECLPITETQERTWKYIIPTFTEKLKNNEFVAIKENGKIKIYEKYRITKGQLIKTHWVDPRYNANTSGTKILDEIMKIKTFDFPKSLYLMKDIINLITSRNDIVLDFFSGSGTTAHATIQLNAEDGGNRKYIMVQIPEKTSEDSEAYKAGYKNICEIGKERIRRAAKKIKEETNAEIDYGFRVYKLSEPIYENTKISPKEQTQNNLFEENIKDNVSNSEILTSVILDLGLELSLKTEEKIIDGKKVYLVEDNYLFACFDKNLDLSNDSEMMKEIIKLKPQRIALLDSSFKDNQDKINFDNLIKQNLPECKGVKIV